MNFIRVTRYFIIVLLLGPIFHGKIRAQSHSAFPVDISINSEPHPVKAAGRIRLLYELRLTNFGTIPVEIAGIDILAGDTTKTLFTFHDGALEQLITPIGPADSTASVKTIKGGRTIVLFFDLALDSTQRVPVALQHRIALRIVKKNGGYVQNVLNFPLVPVVSEPAMVIHAPFHGSGWVAFNGLSNVDHRRVQLTVDGKAWIAQRFAIDWQRIGPDGRLYHGEPNVNANFYCYGADVLAVADGTVSDLRDGIPDNNGNNTQDSRATTLDNIAGNYLILDLGKGYFALYAHLQPGSLKVKRGDKVKTGQVLALLGNTGNSDEPHLHFQLMNANSPLAADGLPYEFISFSELGVLNDSTVLDNGKAWQSKNGKPIVRQKEFPVDNAVITVN